MMKKARVRFAPSPTGTLHIGGARTALFNWLFARNSGGSFVLRVEDTDTTRSTQESADGIIEGLRWLGLDWDEGPEKGGLYGPYRQSERLDIYVQFAKRLLDCGQAYYCFCSPEELEQEREQARQEKRDYRYSGKCCHLGRQEAEERLRNGETAVLRFKVPTAGSTVVEDLIRGQVAFDNQLFDDFIIMKSDGWPTYNFAVVVDDSSMEISHVIRAEEHLSNTPKQLLLYRALGLEPPRFAHVSMILAPDRSKLSKRHGATSVQEFRDSGYLPEALVNYLALLGWSSGEDVDFWTVPELVERFNLDSVTRSPAIYDIEKLTWMNGHYLAQSSADRLLSLVREDLLKAGLAKEEPDYINKVIELVKSRARLLPELLDEAAYFFAMPREYDPEGVKKHFLKGDAVIYLQQVLVQVDEVASFAAANLEEAIRQAADKSGVKAAALIHPTRLALSGRTRTPGLFEVMEVLGRDNCRSRLENAIEYVKGLK